MHSASPRTRSRLVALGLLFAAGLQAAERNMWTIGVLTGPSPFELTTPAGVTNPVLMGSDVTDMKVDTIAHPFMVIEGSRRFVFFTAKEAATDKGGIALAESVDGLTWKFRKTVLREPYVLAHPCVFQWEKEYYLVPEAHTETAVRLYKAVKFPDEWKFEGNLLEGETFISPTLVRFKDRWWMFTSPSGNQTLRLFFASDLKGPWQEHPRSPIVTNDATRARPGGRPLILDGKLYRLAQNCVPTYGSAVRAFEVTAISPTEYAEKEVEKPLVQKDPAGGWNVGAMHHVDAHRAANGQWIAVVDASGRPPRR